MTGGGLNVPIEPASAVGFDEFIDVIGSDGRSGQQINQGLCTRYSDLARFEFSPDGRPGISLFKAQIRTIPYEVQLMERHPNGSQAFIPMGDAELLVVVAPDEGGKPGQPRAAIVGPGKGVNILRNSWHGVLAPLSGSGLFAVVDWIGNRPNLVEHVFDQPCCINR